MILDLEDSVAAAAKPEARRAVADFLDANQPPPRSGCGSIRSTGPRRTRISPRSCTATRTESSFPRPKAAPRSTELARRLTERGNVAAQILAIATETPAAIFQLGTYGGLKRLAGLTWGAEDLPAAIGAATSREQDGRYTPPYELARSLCLFGAAAAGVAPIETVYPAFRDLDGLAAYAARAPARRLHRHDGDPSRPGARSSTPPSRRARRSSPTPGPWSRRSRQARAPARSSLDGRMIDRPHLVQAQRTLAAASGR